ncbi:MAG TPA: hypothetical protein VKG62_04215 [Solirubrobacteraceae bacterium]|nr:hypothetical protein [Solirubrobacteraceae bacterium]
MTDFLDDKRREITERLKELKPLAEEFARLEAAASALAGVGGSASAAATTAKPARRGPGRPRGSAGRTRKAPAAKKAASKATRKTVPKATRKPTRKTTRKPARKATRKPGRPPARRAGRRKGSGTRAAEALAFVQGQPGITIPELAAKMGIKQNYLYRVLPGLEQEKKVQKQGRGWHPRG